ncbi:MAG: CvpA family protein [Campylobacterota bacterium]|nr:CvpA family protein [Campylobacterota bacterium]
MDISTLDFNYFDVTIGSIVVILGIKGMMNGFIKELFGLIGLVGGVYIASRTAEQAGDYIDKNLYHLENTAALNMLGFIAILAIIWIVAVAIGSIFSRLTQASGLGFFNALFGFVVGGGKYFLIFALIVTALSNVTLVKDNLGKYVDSSLLYPYLKDAGSFLINIDPDSLLLEDKNSSSVVSTSSPASSMDINLSTIDKNLNKND